MGPVNVHLPSGLVAVEVDGPITAQTLIGHVVPVRRLQARQALFF